LELRILNISRFRVGVWGLGCVDFWVGRFTHLCPACIDVSAAAAFKKTEIEYTIKRRGFRVHDLEIKEFGFMV